MAKVKYQWRNGTRTKLPAEVVGKWCTETDAPRTPEEMVAAARPKRSPLHAGFEWNDKKAGDEHRLWQARNLLASIEVVVVDGSLGDPEEVVPVYLTQHVPAVGYVNRSVIAKNVDYRTAALEECKSKLDGIRRRYDWLEELGSVWKAIKTIKAKRARVKKAQGR